jgi:two-component system response regulator NreC
MSAVRRIRVFLADDHAILRSGLRLLIDAQPDMQVVGEAGSADEAVREAASLAPDVVTLDLSMPGGPGLRAIERLRSAAPAARVLVLTMHDDPAYVRSALAAGAAGYLVKSAADTALIGGIRAVHRGHLFVDVPRSPALDALIGSARVAEDASSPLASLSAREREVMALVAQGHTNQAVADRLGLSVKTVESYRARLMQKLGLESRADLTRLAADLGLLDRGGDAPPED